MAGREERGRRRVSVTLRGARFPDDPLLPDGVRGAVVPWERVGVGAVYDEGGRRVRLPLRYGGQEGHAGRLARRARARRLRWLLDRGELDVWVRYDSERRRARWSVRAGIGVAVAMIGAFVAMLIDRHVFSARVGWLEGATVVLMLSMALCYAAALIVPGLAGRRVVALAAHFTGEGIEVALPDGSTMVRAWTSVARVEELGLGLYAELVFTGGESLVLPLRRLRELVQWHAERVDPEPARAWRGAALGFALGQTCALVQLWVRPDGAQLDPIEAYVALSGFGLLMGGVLWFHQRSRRPRVRRRPRAAGV